MKTYIYIVISVIVFTLFSCSKTGQTLSKSDFIKTYTSLLIINSDPKLNMDTRKKQIDELFKRNGFTENMFRNSVAKYQNDVFEWRNIYKTIMDSLDSQRNRPYTNIK